MKLQKSLLSFPKSKVPIILILMLLSFLQYFPILGNKLFYDDEELIYKNSYVKNLKFLPKYFTENMIAGAGKQSNMYRPILLLSFAIDYKLWGNNPVGYHLTSIFLHGANAILIFLLLKSLFKNNLVSLLSSLLFIIHPVQTEAVVYASGRTDLLFSFFTLLSLLFFLLFQKGQKHNLLYYGLSNTSFILALLSKETAIIFPLLAILISIIYPQKSKKRRRLIIFALPFIFVSLGYVFLRLTSFNFSSTLNFYQGIKASNEALLYSQNLKVRVFTFTRVFFEYLKILIFPKELVFDRQIDLVFDFFSPWVLFFNMSIITSLIFSFRQSKFKTKFLFVFFWFFITILPVSGIVPINKIITEHYLYLPSVSFFFLISFFFYNSFICFKSVSPKLILVFLLTVGIPLLSFRTYSRSFDWKDPITFYTLSLKQSPWNIPMRHNLAMAYSETGNTSRAIKEYKTLINFADVYPNPHHNLANILVKLGKYKEAEKEYKKAIKLDPTFTFSYYALAHLYKTTGETDKENAIIHKLDQLKKSNKQPKVY